MKTTLKIFTALAALAATFAGDRAQGQARVNWIGPAGVARDWDEGDLGAGEGIHWQSTGVPPENFQPDGFFGSGEYGSISNGGVALIDHVIARSPTDIRLAEDAGSVGTLIIQDGGAINVAATASGAGTLANGVAGGGVGRLVLRQNIGAMSLERYAQTAASTLVAQLTSTAAFNAVQTSASIAVNGTLRIERTPGSTLVVSNGNSWTLFQGAPATGVFTSIDVDRRLLGNAGQVFVPSTSGNSLSISVAQRLVLEVDRFTGAATLRNPAGHAINISLINYTMSSPQNGVDGSNARWSSFDDDPAKPGWFEANPTTTDLSELNPQGMLTLSSGQSHNFGLPINANAAAPLGVDRVNVGDVRFQYQLPTGGFLDAVVQPVGRINDLVLVVNPTTGATIIQNQSSQSLSMIGYTISSLSLTLNTGWTGLQGAGLANWFKANPTAKDLSELSSGGAAVLGVGAELALGTAWNAAAGIEDLTFRYQTPDGVLRNGSVFVGAKAVVTVSNADFNGSGRVDGADFIRWQRGVGLTGQTNNQNGDANGDGAVNSADLAVWRSQFGTTPSASAVVASVPEPAGLMLAAFALVAASRAARRPR